MALGDLGKSIGAGAGNLAAWTRGLSFFALVILFTLTGHLLLSLALGGFKAMGVDFNSLDPGHVNIPALQVFLFAVEAGLVVFALVRSGQSMGKTLVGVAALIFAASMLMLTIVTAQCDLFGVCL